MVSITTTLNEAKSHLKGIQTIWDKYVKRKPITKGLRFRVLFEALGFQILLPSSLCKESKFYWVRLWEMLNSCTSVFPNNCTWEEWTKTYKQRKRWEEWIWIEAHRAGTTISWRSKCSSGLQFPLPLLLVLPDTVQFNFLVYTGLLVLGLVSPSRTEFSFVHL